MGVFFRRQVLAADPGTEKMQEIGAAVEEGAQAYLARQFKTLGVFVVLVFGLLLLLPADTAGRQAGALRLLHRRRAVLRRDRLPRHAPGRQGQRPRRLGGPRTDDRDAGMRIAFRTGGTVGMATVGLGLLGASVVVLLYKGDAPKVLEGFGFGAALLAMFMRVGGGIFTKAADVGADLVGKVEAGIPEDDPRNAATIADNVGDNVGDCAGMAADLFESYAVMLVAALILGSVAFGEYGLVFPLIVPAIGAVTALLGVFITKVKPGRERPQGDQPRLLHLGRHLRRALGHRGLRLPARHLRRAVKAPPNAARSRRSAATRGSVGGPRRRHRHRAGRHHPLAHRLLHRHRQAPDQGRRPHLAHRRGDRRALRHRRRPGVGRLHRGDHRRRRLPRVPARRRLGRPVAVPHRARRLRPAHHGRRHRRHGHLRPGLRQRAGHRRDVR